MQVGKLYQVQGRVTSVPVYERVHMHYPINNDYTYTPGDIYDRHIDWYDPADREWGYRFCRLTLNPDDIFMVLEINTRVVHAWSTHVRPDHIGIRFLKGDITGWIYQPLDSPCFKLISP